MKTSERETELEATLRELVESIDEMGFPRPGDLPMSTIYRAENAMRKARRALKPPVKEFGKRREGLSRSEIDHPGLSD